MAVLIGGTDDFPGKNNRLVGTEEQDFIFGDPFTTGASDFGVSIPEVGGPLSGRGGNDRLAGGEGGDYLHGDTSWVMTGNNIRGGDDRLTGGEGDDVLNGDAGDLIIRNARGGDDWLDGGEGNDDLRGDAPSIAEGATGGADTFVFAPDSGLDTILDFEQGKNRLDVRAYGITAAQFGQYAQDHVVDFDQTAADVDEVRVFALDPKRFSSRSTPWP